MSEDTKHALVNSAERLLSHESLKGFDAEGEFSNGERPFPAKMPIAESLEIDLGVIVRTVAAGEHW